MNGNPQRQPRTKEEYYSSVQEHREPITSLEVVRFRDAWMDVVREVLNRHECLLQDCETHCVITFPEGTTKAEIVPRTYDTRYAIYLPDGAEFMEVLTRDGRSYLNFAESERQS